MVRNPDARPHANHLSRTPRHRARALAAAVPLTLHSVPFDRILVARTRHLRPSIVAADANIDRYDVREILL